MKEYLIKKAENRQYIDINDFMRIITSLNYHTHDVLIRYSTNDAIKDLSRGKILQQVGKVKDREISIHNQNGQVLLFLSTKRMFDGVIQEKIRNFVLNHIKAS